nr:hypothetical protein [Tanacetum cinerariifolium]
GCIWSIAVEEGKPVDSAGSGAITLAIGAINSETGSSTLGGRITVEEGKPVDSAGSGAITLAIGAINSETGSSTLGGRISNSSNNG